MINENRLNKEKLVHAQENEEEEEEEVENRQTDEQQNEQQEVRQTTELVCVLSLTSCSPRSRLLKET